MPILPCSICPRRPAMWLLAPSASGGRRSGRGGARPRPGRQGLLVLVHLRKGSTYQELADAFGLGLATVYRYVGEAVELLAGLAGCPTAALLRARAGDLLILDGTLIVTGRLPDRAIYSGKHKQYGVNVQQFTDSRGEPIWSGPGLPGSTHDLSAIRATGLLPTLDWLTARGVVVLADKGYQGIGSGVLIPYKGRELTEPYTEANRTRAAARSIGERGFAWHSSVAPWSRMASIL